MMSFFIRDLGYTGVGDRDSKRKLFFTKTFPKLVDDIQNFQIQSWWFFEEIQTDLMTNKEKVLKLAYHPS